MLKLEYSAQCFLPENSSNSTLNVVGPAKKIKFNEKMWQICIKTGRLSAVNSHKAEWFRQGGCSILPGSGYMTGFSSLSGCRFLAFFLSISQWAYWKSNSQDRTKTNKYLSTCHQFNIMTIRSTHPVNKMKTWRRSLYLLILISNITKNLQFA